MQVPVTQYAESDGVYIAYQVVGEGDIDLLFLPMWFSHVEMIWEAPYRRFVLERLASFARLILFDQRGTGLSDSVAISDTLTLEDRAKDALAVLDAVGSKQVALFAAGPTAPLACFLAAAHADRTRALLLLNASARLKEADGYDVASARRIAPSQAVVEHWGRPTWSVGRRHRTDAENEELARYQRNSLGPGGAEAMFRSMWDIDVREILPAISVPTLVLHRSGNRAVPPDHGRYLADHINDATYVEIGGRNFTWTTENEPDYLDDLQEFLTGVRPAPQADRVLATVLFTDVVESTATASQLGDAAWRRLLEQHAAIVRREVERANGRLIRVAGEESLATFDGPARAIRCARAIGDQLRNTGLEVRAGLHTGEIELLGDDIGGIAVHIGARVAAIATAGEVLVSSTVKDLVVGSGLSFDDRGLHELKGVPGEWRVFAVVSD